MKPTLFASLFMLLAGTSTILCASQPTDATATQAQATAARATAPAPVPPPRTNEKLRKILAAMDDASTWGHPDLFGQFAGMRRLFKGDYKGAMKYFRIGARFADKLSQLSIGMMYLHGRGVSKDPAMACAWITLAAERGYPTYISARDRICGSLLPAQHDRAMAALDTLRPQFGDTVAKQRMKLQLTIARNSLTGGIAGHDVSNVKVYSMESFPGNCSGDVLSLGGLVVPIRGCGMYDPSLLDPKKYFAARDAQWHATVSVGRLTKVNPPVQRTEAKQSDDKP